MDVLRYGVVMMRPVFSIIFIFFFIYFYLFYFSCYFLLPLSNQMCAKESLRSNLFCLPDSQPNSQSISSCPPNYFLFICCIISTYVYNLGYTIHLNLLLKLILLHTIYIHICVCTYIQRYILK